MTPTELRALIDARTDKEFSDAREAGDAQRMAELLSVGRVRHAERMITKRGIRSTLGAHEGRAFLSALRAYAAASRAVPAGHPAADELWWLAELLPDLDAGGAGIDIGNAETRTALRSLAQLGPALNPAGPNVTTAHCDALDALSRIDDPISAAEVGEALK